MDFKVQMHCDLFSILSFKIHVVTLILLINLESYMQTKVVFNNTTTRKKKKKHPQDLRNWLLVPKRTFLCQAYFSVIGFSFLDSLVTLGPGGPHVQLGLRFVFSVPFSVGDVEAPGTSSCVHRAAVSRNKEWAWPVSLTYSVGVGVLTLLVSSRRKDFFIHAIHNHTLKVILTCVFPMTHLFTLFKND